MGRATIISGGTDGQYTIQPIYDTATAEVTISKLEAGNTAIDARLVELASEIDDRSADSDFIIAEIRAAEDDPAQVESLQESFDEIRLELFNLATERSILTLKRAANIKRIEFLTMTKTQPPSISAWCADFTEDASGEVGTIEIGRVDSVPIILPGGAVADQGHIQKTMLNSPAGMFCNYALLAGADKWKPRYRTGTVGAVDKDADTMSVTLDALTIAGQNCNQTGSLSAVPVVYMDCNAEAFKDGDAVVVDFAGDWSTPTVIGFVTGPINCCEDFSEIDGPEFVEVDDIYSVTGGVELVAIFNSGALDDISEEPTEGEKKLWQWQVTTVNDPCEDEPLITVTALCPEDEPYEKIKVLSCECLELELSGPIDCEVGSVYTATHGKEPYVYSFNGGTINSATGEILTVNSCSTPGTLAEATVTVTDSCWPDPATLKVRIPGGEWVRTDYVDYCAQDWECSCGDILEVGSTRYIEYWGGMDGATPCSEGMADFFEGICLAFEYSPERTLYPPCTMIAPPCPSNSLGPFKCIGLMSTAEYEWRCQ